MTPPQLPADAPVALFAQPIEIGFGITLGEEADLTGCDGIHGHLCQAGLALVAVPHANEPLIGQIRLDRGFAAVAVLELDVAVFAAVEKPEFFHVLGHFLAGLVAVQPLVRPAVFVDGAVGIEDVDHRQLVPQAAAIVVGIVGRCHLDRAGAQCPDRPARRRR